MGGGRNYIGITSCSNLPVVRGAKDHAWHFFFSARIDLDRTFCKAMWRSYTLLLIMIMIKLTYPRASPESGKDKDGHHWPVAPFLIQEKGNRGLLHSISALIIIKPAFHFMSDDSSAGNGSWVRQIDMTEWGNCPDG